MTQPNICQGCGIEIPADKTYCPVCEKKLSEGSLITAETFSPEEQDKYLRGFSWGAAVTGIFYLYAMEISSSLMIGWIIAFIIGSFTYGLLDIALFFWLGFAARRQAWQSRKWKDFAEFKSTQDSWDRYSKIILLVEILVVIIGVTLAIKSIGALF